MGTPTTPQPVKLFVAMTYTTEERLRLCAMEMENEYGPIDVQSHSIPFEFTDYYFQEMGRPLFKKFLAFEPLVDPGILAAVKHRTNRFEDEFRIDGRRTVNIDPGYLDGARVVLATTKDFDHRIYLRDGIYADLHLRFRDGDVLFNPWTYPDYRTGEARRFFLQARARWLEQRRAR